MRTGDGGGDRSQALSPESLEFSPSTGTLIFGVLQTCAALIIFAMAALSPPAWSPILRVLFLVMGLAGFYVAVGTLRSRVLVDSNGIMVRRALSWKTFSWKDLAALSVEPFFDIGQAGWFVVEIVPVRGRHLRPSATVRGSYVVVEETCRAIQGLRKAG